MEFYEIASGARMHAAYYRPISLRNSLPSHISDDILNFIEKNQKTLTEISGILTENRIWRNRLLNIGSYSYREVQNYGLSGVMARCTGLKRDIRFNRLTTYGNYFFSNSRSFITYNGDSLDRYFLRMQEMFESMLIITKTISRSNTGSA